jgi:hypothetical protein
VKWALSLGLWSNLGWCPFTNILDVMKDAGLIGTCVSGSAGFLKRYNLTATQLRREPLRQNLHLATVAWA